MAGSSPAMTEWRDLERQTGTSPAGLTRGSIVLRKMQHIFVRGWIGPRVKPGEVKPGNDDGRGSRVWRSLLLWLQRTHPLSCYLRMARIAIIALILFATAPALGQQPDTN